MARLKDCPRIYSALSFMLALLVLFSATAAFSQKSKGDAEIDPDAPLLGKRIDAGEYLRMRENQIAALRGVFTAKSRQDRVKAILQMKSQEEKLRQQTMKGGASILSAVAWTPLGPEPIPNGQTNPVNSVSGRVTAIAVNPTNPNIVYVGAAQGGLYRSLDGGTTWTQMMGGALSLAIGSVAIAPSSPSTVYVGTGEGNASLDSFFGVGIYRIDNADGANPTLVGPLNKDGGGTDVFTGSSVDRIVVDPSNANNVFAATNFGFAGTGGFFPFNIPAAGIFRSTNATAAAGGVTFTRLTTGLPSFSSFGYPATDVVMDPSNPNNLVVALTDEFFGDVNGGIYRTTNALTANAASVTFTKSFAFPKGTNANLAINKVGSTVTVLAGTSEGNGKLRVSADGGATFPTTLPAENGFCGGQCFYDIVVGLDPGNASTMYVGGSTAPIFAKSTNAGSTFTELDAGLHADSHALGIAPSNTSILYFGNDGGIFKSTNGGTTWASLNNSTFLATQFESLAVHPSDPNFTIGGTQDNGTNFFQPNATWTRADFGDGGYSEIDQNAADNTNVTMYHTYFNRANNLTGFAQVMSVANANDGHWSFFGCPDGVNSNNGIVCADPVLFYAPMALGPGNPNTVYFGTNTLYRSADQGVTMPAISQAPIVANQEISSIGISAQNDNVRIVGLTNGKIFATTNGSTTLTDVTPSSAAYPSGNYVARAIIDPNNSNTAYITLAGYLGSTGNQIWKTTNLVGGPATWSASSSGIPDVPVDALVIDPLDPNHVYAGTDIGMFVSEDGGATWNPFGSGLPRVAVFDARLQNSSRKVRIATHGLGIWQLSAIPLLTSTGVVTSGSPSVPGQSVTFTATVAPVAPAIGIPTGSVTFFAGGTTLGTVAVSGGTAAFTTSSLAAGTYTISADYSGSLTYSGSSNTVIQIVQSAATTTNLVTSVNPSSVGQNVTFTASVSPVGQASPVPSGSVTFDDNGSTIGTGTLSAGVATLNTSALTVGVHPITAVYGGDGFYNPSTSNTISQSVITTGTNSTVTALTVNGSSSSVTVNTGVVNKIIGAVFQISVAATSGDLTGGKVVLLDGNHQLGPVLTLAVTSATAGTASYQTQLSIGLHNVTAVYLGNSTTNGSTSNAVAVQRSPKPKPR